MTPEFKKLFQSLQKRDFAPFYLIDGEEPYYIDRITEFFEEQILPPHERDFNLITLYGKDVEWADVVNACRRFPMFAERQVVILKDAAQMRTLNELVNYLDKPAPTTVFLIEHRFKKVDGRGKLVKVAKEKGIYFTSDKVRDDKVPDWIRSYGDGIGFKIGEREAETLTTFLGNDLQKIANEIEKVRINVPEETALTAEHIRKYIGVSREYNVFEFPETLTSGDAEKRYRMLSYFISNPKNAAMPFVVGVFYNYFNRLYSACFVQGKTEGDAAKAIGIPPFRVRETIGTAQRLGAHRLEECLLILSDFSAKAVGMNNQAGDAELLKEMVARMERALA